MSVVINSNAAATVAANNLAASNTALQKSLNRLSSGSKIVNPADDAGGLAVSMKLSAAAKRQGAVENNIANATSLLQTQDGVLSVTAKILNRISELKVLNNDVTKSSSDKANYDSEFKALQAQITANADEKFNGVALFGTKDLSVPVTEDGNTSVTAKGIDLLGSAPGVPYTFTSTGPGDSAYFTPSGAGTLTVTSGGIFLSSSAGNDAWCDDAGGTATYDGAGGWTFSGLWARGGTVAGDTIFLVGSINTGRIGSASFTPSGGSSGTGNTRSVANATDLGSLDLTKITGAIEDTATYRAQNGATQSRLGFASELVTVNKANLEAATSRITDVDVAQESTVLARNNVLVSAGTSMLAQANQSSQMALKLLS